MYFQNLLLILVLATVAQCNNTKISAQSSENNIAKHEGIIYLKHRVDATGDTLNITKNDSVFLSVKRPLFIYQYSLIEVGINENYVNGIYKNTDTSWYKLIDYTLKKHCKFDRLSGDGKILNRGFSITKNEFSSSPEFDPLNEIPDSSMIVSDTTLTGKTYKIVKLKVDDPDPDYRNYMERMIFWIDPSIKGFPIQMSYILSKKFDNGFVFKTHMPFMNTKSISITELDFTPRKLPDSLISIFKKWQERMKENID